MGNVAFGTVQLGHALDVARQIRAFTAVTIALKPCSGVRYCTACAYHLPVMPGTREPTRGAIAVCRRPCFPLFEFLYIAMVQCSTMQSATLAHCFNNVFNAECAMRPLAMCLCSKKVRKR